MSNHSFPSTPVHNDTGRQQKRTGTILLARICSTTSALALQRPDRERHPWGTLGLLAHPCLHHHTAPLRLFYCLCDSDVHHHDLDVHPYEGKHLAHPPFPLEYRCNVVFLSLFARVTTDTNDGIDGNRDVCRGRLAGPTLWPEPFSYRNRRTAPRLSVDDRTFKCVSIIRKCLMKKYVERMSVQQFDQYMHALIKRDAAPSLAITAVREGNTVVAGGYGHPVLGGEAITSVQTVYLYGSMAR